MKKLKILAVTLVVAAIIVATVSTTVAFFTEAKESQSVFTAGNVYITLSEAAVVADSGGNLIEDPSRDRIFGKDISSGETVVNDYGYIFPGETIHKDPTVKNVGNGKAWVAAKVIIEDGVGNIHRLYCYDPTFDNLDIERLLTGGLLDEAVHVSDWNGIPDVCFNENYAMIQSADMARGRYEFFFIMEKPLEPGGEVEIFDTVFFDSAFDNAEMNEFRELKITVQAFAVQVQGFDSCLEAMTTAFGEHFIRASGE